MSRMDSEALLTLPGRPTDRLDTDAIAAALPPDTARLVERLDVFAEIDSTNRHLLEHPPSAGRLAVCLAEYQHAGRGRRGRAWVAPEGGALCLSVGWQFADRPLDLPALTLACGVAARRALETQARVAVRLKWPNDLVWDDRKLGGILVELGSEPGRFDERVAPRAHEGARHAHDGARRACHAVVGIGVNVAMAPDCLRRVSDWPRGAVDLREAMQATQASRGEPPRRSPLAAALVAAFAEVLASYPSVGFAPYRAEFAAADWLDGRAIRVDEAAGVLQGVARGIAPDGALRVEVGAGRMRRVTSGDVSVRWAAE
jgi:BirA family biotin operon repressor/biotin-[acetyl-CoA-carboxylase] ligase